MIKEHSLFESQDARPAPANNGKVSLAAHRLTIYFSQDDDLPARYRRKPTKTNRVKEDSKLEKAFKERVKSWSALIDTMLSKIDDGQAWRFVNLAPEVPPTAHGLTECKDFCDFVDYLILRRDKEDAGPDEVGGLAQLLTPFQRKIEERIKVLSAAKSK